MDPLAHASIGLIAKPLVPKAPLWALLAATQVPDLLSFGFMAAGLEHGAVTQLTFKHGLEYLSPPFIPWSHGLFMSVVWSVVVAAIAWLFLRDRRTSVAIGLMVLSHWLLDFIVYLNIPVFFDNTPTIGLGLITSSPGLIMGIILEVSLISAGLIVFWVTRKRKTHDMRR
jgi:membrane-bound metal-dependent hydrolase YbcI (DUF457 family)